MVCEWILWNAHAHARAYVRTIEAAKWILITILILQRMPTLSHLNYHQSPGDFLANARKWCPCGLWSVRVPTYVCVWVSASISTIISLSHSHSHSLSPHDKSSHLNKFKFIWPLVALATWTVRVFIFVCFFLWLRLLSTVIMNETMILFIFATLWLLFERRSISMQLSMER